MFRECLITPTLIRAAMEIHLTLTRSTNFLTKWSQNLGEKHGENFQFWVQKDQNWRVNKIETDSKRGSNGP
jgi:hypothetical protein